MITEVTTVVGNAFYQVEGGMNGKGSTISEMEYPMTFTSRSSSNNSLYLAISIGANSYIYWGNL